MKNMIFFNYLLTTMLLILGLECFGHPVIEYPTTDTSIQKSIDYYKKAENSWENNDFKGALENIDLSIQSSPNNARAYYFRGAIYCFGLQNYQMAINDFTNAIQLDPNAYQSYFYRGLSFYKLDKHKEAIEDLSKVIIEDQDNTDAYFLRARSKQFLYEFQNAVYDYNQIVKRKSVATSKFYTMSGVYFDISYNLNVLNRPKEALPYIESALKLDNTKSHYFEMRGELFYKLQDFKKCIDDMNRAISVNDKRPHAYFLRGLSKIKTGESNNGCDDLHMASQLGETEAIAAISQYCR